MAIRMAKRTQHCTFCKNHGINIPKKGHHCPHQNCTCLLCKLNKKAQVAMRHQQRVWRHQKQKLKSQKFEDNELSAIPGDPKSSKSQACDKCRNHNILKLKRNHNCPFQNCKCDYCSLTFKRREIMKHQQRVRRLKITSQMESDGAPSAGEEPEEDEGEYSYCSEENRKPSSAQKDNVASFTYNETNISTENKQLHDVEIQDMSVPSTSVSLRSTPDTEIECSTHVFPVYSPQSEHFSSHGLEELSGRESPPPLIQMMGDKISENESMSPPLNNVPKRFHSESTRSGTASPVAENTFLAPHFESMKEEALNNLRPPSLMFFQKENPALKSFPFSSQPLERLTALNASLDPSLKFTNSLEDLHIRNYSFLPSTFIDSSLRTMTTASAPSILAPQYSYQNHLHPQFSNDRNPTTHQPIRPLPLNYGQTRTQNGFTPNFWNRMIFPFHFGLPRTATETSYLRFQSLVGSSRFSPFNHTQTN